MCRASCHRSLARVSPFLSLCFPSGGGKEAEACHVVNGVEGQSTQSVQVAEREGTVFVAREQGGAEARECGDWE